MGKLVFYIQIASGIVSTLYKQVTFPPFTVGAVAVLMGSQTAENIDNIDNFFPHMYDMIDSIPPYIRYGQIARALDFPLNQLVQGSSPWKIFFV
jgi:hypothetical protein